MQTTSDCMFYKFEKNLNCTCHKEEKFKRCELYYSNYCLGFKEKKDAARE